MTDIEFKEELFMNEEDMEAPIYRIFPIHRFLEILKRKEMVLVKPELWEDPFENPLNYCKFVRKSDKAPINAEMLYGQCWSLNEESDAMWRIYSPNNNGVMVSTTPRKLLNSLKQATQSNDFLCFIGKVQYVNAKDLLNEISPLAIASSEIAKTLLYKRAAFSHEREIRLIYFSCKNNEDRIFKFHIEPNNVFNAVLFDSRLTQELQESYTAYMLSLGYNFEISRSTLYDLPDNI